MQGVSAPTDFLGSTAYACTVLQTASRFCIVIKTSCAHSDTICLHPLQVDNIFAFIHQVVVLFRHNNIFVFIRQVAPVLACWLFKTSATSSPLTFWPWKRCPSHVWRGLPLLGLQFVAYLLFAVFVAYIMECAKVSLPRPLCSHVRPDVCDRQTDVRHQHQLMPPPYGGGA